MHRLVCLIFLLLLNLPLCAQDLIPKLTGKWSLISRSYVGPESEESVTWNPQPKYRKLVLEFRSDSTACWYNEERTSDITTHPFTTRNELITLNESHTTSSYQIEKLIRDTLVLRQLSIQYASKLISEPNVIHYRLILHRTGEAGSKSNVESRPVLLKDSIVIEEMPEYPGGSPALMKLLEKNISYPKQAYRDKVSGTVIAGFTISESGEVVEGHITHAPRIDMAMEVVRVLKTMKRWIPGKQNGKSVPVRYSFPVQFSR